MLHSLLPTSLLALVFASPVFSAPSSPNDPFRDIALQAPKPEEPPVCCLRPLDPVEPSAGDDVFISFEDWKAKRLSEAREHPPLPSLGMHNVRKPAVGKDGVDGASADNASSPSPVVGTAQGSGQQDAADIPQHDERLAPQLRIPIVDRFNYASTDCSARVHAAHRSAKSPSSILSSKKDRYMLSPCAEEKQFVVVELCDDIMIDTVQLANYEFFSGVFKEFSVSVAKTSPTDDEGWTHAGTYRARNVRGVQTFHPPPTLRDFYRFIRVDFHSHYGNEYYCPLSLLRVYGLTHLEQWKWDEWEEQSRARRAIEDASAAAEGSPEPPQAAHVPVAVPAKPDTVETVKLDDEDVRQASNSRSAIGGDHSLASVPGPDTPATLELEATSSPQHAQEAEPSVVALSATTTASEKAMPSIHATIDAINDPHVSHTILSIHSDVVSAAPPVSSSTDSMAVVDTAVSSSSIHLESAPSLYNPHTSHVTHSSRIPSTAANSSSTASSAISVVAAQSHSLPPAPPVVLPPISTGGESIYRTIMNRLTALEGNTTLYARYVEEQTAGIREVLLRMGEDLGRLEGIGKAQAQMYQRSVTEFDRQRKKLEREHRELLVKVNHLTDEVVLEKRLGIIQLCLLLAVLVFMTLTRGSRGEHASAHRAPGSTRHMGVREWGRRTLSFSGDWVARFRSRSPTPKPVARPESKPSEHHEAKVEFPSRSASTQTPSHRPFLSPVPHSPTSPHALPRSATRHLTARPRTPSALRVSTPRAHNAHAHARSSRTPPPSARPQMTRSTSSSAGFGPTIIGAVPKSAKRWARSAHLHEVKSPNRPATAFAGIEGQPRPLDAERPYTLDAVRESESADLPHAALVSEGATPAVAVDVFSPKSEAAFSRASTASIGRGKQPRPTLSPLHLSAANDLPRMCVVSGATPASDAEGSEGDVWVDTDVEGSESDSGGLAGMVPDPVEHAAQAA